MLNDLKVNHYSLWYRLWQGYGWAFNLFFGIVIIGLLSVIVTVAILNDGLYQVASYLATSPTFAGMPFQMRLAIMGGGLFIVMAIAAALWELVRYFYIRPNKITHQDLDIQLTAVVELLQRLEARD